MPFAQAADHRLTGLYACLPQDHRKPRSMTGEGGKADRRRAVVHRFQRAEPVNSRRRVPRPTVLRSRSLLLRDRIAQYADPAHFHFHVSPCFIQSGGVR